MLDWDKIKQAGISSKPPTHRGTRAGRNRLITVITDHGRSGEARFVESKVNMNNLTRIGMVDQGNKLEFSVSVINCQSFSNKTGEIMMLILWL
jgi:hypothetical protein